ncbi:hypothetical protein ACIRPH_06775 [Nocardiopsis sp. NPDC101807]|uniref:hypothetical protein n=1 Tax=Nocardiopsis sp. NPDC101807 TaxID=3364339 RepID=UPI0037F5EF4B
MGTAKRTPEDRESLEEKPYSAGVGPEEMEEGTRLLLAEARGHRPALTRNRPVHGRQVGQHRLTVPPPPRPADLGELRVRQLPRQAP